ncbi:class I SAM-dependent methyltransferase [Mangrovimonas sp. AS39]|uniref:class I SAM-dependent methyltransferase n=1 Tax=Mangrovimonas futianensis TaxID=2895523 RepID=UPI001E44117C|nr:class I SAM-dependent methyltransferase [Mangrovimonas futianensis]MCF1191505.1 class I SAM-dependent methyltransferase [Mangrovimonas futianensis]MCF1195200.1 class I SAM-dependent methyltransferase [Mangrovimonas futianensis]
MKDFWNNRYQEEEYTYGTRPNEYFKEKLRDLNQGSLLLPAEGQGRNAVYAALQNWEVTAFDYSEVGRKKALELAAKNGVEFNYQVCDALDFESETLFDVIGFSFTHFPVSIQKQVFQNLLKFLKPGGHVIFEGFSKEQLNFSSGGPKDKDMLFSPDEVKDYFDGLEFLELRKDFIILDEGEYHQGEASVIRFFAKKAF